MTFWFSAFLGHETVRSFSLIHEKENAKMETCLETFQSTWHRCDSKRMISGLLHRTGCGPVWMLLNLWVVSGMWCELYQSLGVQCVLVCNGLEIKGKKMGSLPQMVWGRASLLACHTPMIAVSSYCVLDPWGTWESPGEAWTSLWTKLPLAMSDQYAMQISFSICAMKWIWLESATFSPKKQLDRERTGLIVAQTAACKWTSRKKCQNSSSPHAYLSFKIKF